MLVTNHHQRITIGLSYFNRNDFGLEITRSARYLSPSLCLRSVGILGLAINFIDLRSPLRRLTHKVSTQWAHEPITIHSVDYLRIPHSIPETGFGE